MACVPDRFPNMGRRAVSQENLASGQAKLFLSPDSANLQLGSPLTFDGTAQDYFG